MLKQNFIGFAALVTSLVVTDSAQACHLESSCLNRPPQCLVLQPKWDNIYFIQPVAMPLSLKTTYECGRRRKTVLDEEIQDYTRQESHQLFRTPETLSDIDPKIRSYVTKAAHAACEDGRVTAENLFGLCP